MELVNQLPRGRNYCDIQGNYSGRTDSMGAVATMSDETDRENYVALATRVRKLEKIIDTWNTPLWKRMVFVIKGYRFRKLGRWYKARWNEDAKEYD